MVCLIYAARRHEPGWRQQKDLEKEAAADYDARDKSSE